MQIRAATLSEIPAVVSMARRAYELATGKSDFNEAVSAGNWIHLVSMGEGIVLTVMSDTGPEGVLCGYKSRNIDTGKLIAQMWHWYVEAPAKGHGGHLLKRFEAWAKEQGCDSVGVGCLPQLWSDRHKGIYDRLGYKLDGLSFSKEI